MWHNLITAHLISYASTYCDFTPLGVFAHLGQGYCMTGNVVRSMFYLNPPNMEWKRRFITRCPVPYSAWGYMYRY